MDARFHALLVLHHVHLYGLFDHLPEGPDPAGHRRDLRPVPLVDRRDFAGQARLALRARPADGASGPGQSVRELTGRGSPVVDDRYGGERYLVGIRPRTTTDRAPTMVR